MSKFITVALAIVAVALMVSSASAVVITSIQQHSLESGPQLYTVDNGYLSNSDLVNQGSAALASVNSTGGVANFGGSLAMFNDGLAGNYAASSASMNPDPNASITFNLNGAYDIGSIVLYSRYDDGGRVKQAWTLSVSTDGTNFTDISTVTGAEANNGTVGMRQEVLSTTSNDSSPILASGVQAIRVTFGDPSLVGGYSQVCYGEMDVYAAASIPEPSTLALLAAGLFGLLAYAWRKRK